MMRDHEIAEGRRLLARAEWVIASLHTVCKCHAVICALALGALVVALHHGDHVLAVAVTAFAVVVQVAHLALHLAAHVLSKQLLAFGRRKTLSALGGDIEKGP